ncbi:hotdog domain-containing protein [Noviherbaspirillum sp. Root189]|uniref:hotdog domain-containing protein n=1 Tax=Noviherbaspirillum sp. Root189 TaxID=1736487 RepID=UPI00190FE648
MYAGGIRFFKPIFIGQIVKVSAMTIHTGTSSMNVKVEIAAIDPNTGDRKITTLHDSLRSRCR